MAAFYQSTLNNVYDEVSVYLPSIFLNFVNYSHDDKAFLLDELRALVQQDLWYTEESMQPMYAQLDAKYSVRRGVEVTPVEILDRLRIMQTRLQLFTEFYGKPGVTYNRRRGIVRTDSNYARLIKNPSHVEKRFADEGFRNYRMLDYCFRIRRLPIPPIRVLSKFDIEYDIA